MALPTATRPDIYPQDLVSFGPGVCDSGLVIRATTVDAHTFKIQRHDNSVVTKKAADVTLIDRGYLHATQVVASASDVGGQLGVVTGVTTLLDLVKVDERGQVVEVVSGVSPSRLRPVRPLRLGDFVVSGPCLGQVVEVSVDVTVSFDDGALCRVTDAEYRKLQPDPVGTRRVAYYRPQMNCRFHPGQRVTCKKRVAIFKDARWLRGRWNADRLVGTVVKVDMSGVLVYWIWTTDRRLVEASVPPPAYHQNPHDLTLFCAASVYCGWGPADRCFFTQHPEEEHRDDQEMFDDHCEAPPIRTNNRKKRGRRWAQRRVVGRQVDKQVDIPMIVAKTRASVDVLWQDGTREHGKPSESLVPFTVMNEQEFFPGQHVVDNAPPLDDGATATITNDPDDAEGTGPTRRAGVVRSVCCEDRTVDVAWFKAAACPNEAREVECNDTVSAYDLKQIDRSVFEGHIVVRLPPPGSIDGGSTLVEHPTQSKKKRKNGVAPAADLSWMGHVVDRPDGHVQVRWGDGSMSKVLPHEIAIVYETDFRVLQQAMGDWVEDNDIDSAEEPVAANTDNDPRNPGEADSDQANEDGLAVTITGRLTSAVRSLLRLAGEALARGKGFLTDRPPSSLPSSEFPAATENVGAPANLSELPSDATTMTSEAKNDADVACEEFAWEGKKTAESARGDDSFLFPNFDVLQSPPDHHYLDTAHQNERQSGSTREKSWAKTVQKEWKILKNDLPETIYVQACDDRMDLLRAVIVGASGTPYQDGLFFFDLQLPPSYPAIPPQVYYHSFGLRLNPNLYESGTVCLSLLNTFDGEGTEVWSPTRSSLLQVLVSIQGLVLNNQPYYNEAGYETLLGTPVGRRNALPYGENAYLLSLQTMLQLLRRPPQGFEEFVKDHFRRRGRFVLMTCEGYLQGCPDGTLMGEANTTDAARGGPCSAGLKLALANVTSKLVAAFTEIGADECQEFQKLRVPLPCALSTNN